MNSFSFSTTDLPVPERRNAVRALHERGIRPLEPLADRPVTVQISKHFLPGVGILSGTMSGLRHGSTAKSADVSDELFFGVNLDGGCTAFQGKHEIALNGGEAMCLSREIGPFVIVRPKLVRFLGLRVPRNMIAPLVIAFDVGFGDISYFNRAFRRHFNAAPSDIRNFNRD